MGCAALFGLEQLRYWQEKAVVKLTGPVFSAMYSVFPALRLPPSIVHTGAAALVEHEPRLVPSVTLWSEKVMVEAA
jgi:hypothetical protein